MNCFTRDKAAVDVLSNSGSILPLVNTNDRACRSNWLIAPTYMEPVKELKEADTIAGAEVEEEEACAAYDG